MREDKLLVRKNLIVIRKIVIIMKKITIKEYKKTKCAYTIVLENVRFDENGFEIIEKIIKRFMVGDELFFGFYRTDGVNITSKQFNDYEKEIKDFFELNGEIKKQNTYLAVAQTTINHNLYKILPRIFDYYLDTVLFNPKISWETFEKYHFEYMEHTNEDYIINNYADFIFSYFDSGDFLVCFNPENYDAANIRNVIDNIISEVKNQLKL